MGENGAGKSTLMKVLGGVWPYPSYQGDIFINGEKRQFRSTREAMDAGIAIIHQELNLIPELTVAENIFLDRQPINSFGAIDWRRMNADAAALLGELGNFRHQADRPGQAHRGRETADGRNRQGAVEAGAHPHPR